MAGLTSERLRELLHYEPLTGVFTRLKSVSANARAGDVAGSLNEDGYVQIGIDGVIFYAQRLAFLYMTGSWPTAIADHEDTNRSNNRWLNLRDVSNAVNLQNKRVARPGTVSGLLGVTWCKRMCMWKAQITLNRINHALGYFSDKYAAHAAYVEAKRRLHVGCTL